MTISTTYDSNNDEEDPNSASPAIRRKKRPGFKRPSVLDSEGRYSTSVNSGDERPVSLSSIQEDQYEGE